MIVRTEKCPYCGETVVVIMPDLFPNLTADKLERFRKRSEAPIQKFCKKCSDKKGK